jgi:hypothetical protein
MPDQCLTRVSFLSFFFTLKIRQYQDQGLKNTKYYTKPIILKSWEIMSKKDDTILSIGELAKLSGFRQSTLKYYTEIGILPFTQDGERLLRKYKKDEALKRLEEIKKLKEKRFTIKEIVNYFI